MRAKLLTLRFSPVLGRFDDSALVSLQQQVILECVREHIVQVGGEAMLLCVALWRERAGAATEEPRLSKAGTAPPRTAAPAPVPPEAPTEPAVNPRAPARPVGELRQELGEEQRVLFDRVRRWRSEKARHEGAPHYVILTNRQLVECVRQRPTTKQALGRIKGLGDKKVARYGQELLALLWPEPPTEERAGAPNGAAEVLA